jgi:hypothetical protein
MIMKSVNKSANTMLETTIGEKVTIQEISHM